MLGVYRSPVYDAIMARVGRYHRQQILPGVGEDGQERLARSHAAIVGLGALGSAIADHLARAGVGRVTLIDRDLVDHTNLQRQSLYTERDAAEQMPKAEAARRRLAEVNSQITLDAHIADLTCRNIGQLLAGPVSPGRPDVILDGTDNFETRYLLNDLAVRDGVPFVYGGVVGTRGMQTTIRPGTTPCLRCLFEDPPAPGTQPTCDTAGVLGPVVAIVAGCQASDAIRLMLGQGEQIPASLLEFDLWAGHRRRLDLADARRESCPCCGLKQFKFLAGDAASHAATLCGQNAVQISPPDRPGGPLDLASLAERLRALGEVRTTPFMVRATLPAEQNASQEDRTLTVFRDGRAIVSGTASPDHARALYARYVGS